MKFQIGLFTFAFLVLNNFIFSQKTTTIKGYAPSYIGDRIEIYEIEDYFSLKESLIGSSTVKNDSTFSVTFYNSSYKKVVVRAAKNNGYLLVQPGAEYEIFVPEKSKFDIYNPNGNQLELAFLDLKQDDINYKVLSFDKWVNTFLGNFYYKKSLGTEFARNLDTFKLNVENAYKDDTNRFFKTYVRFSIASLDDLQYTGSRNRYEKFDFYLHNFPVSYENEAYMLYIKTFYENFIPRLSMETNNRVYLGLLKSSPTLIMRALDDEYTLKPKNTRLRELIMIKSLSDSYFTGDLPQTNIMSVLDSVSKHSIYPENGKIAANLIYRLTELVPGSKAPDFVLKASDNSTRTLFNYQKKYLYIQFVDLTLKESWKEIELLKPIQLKYLSEIQVLTIFIKPADLNKKQREQLKLIPWETIEINSEDEILKSYHISSYPSYVLIDPYGYVVASPALKPSPNGQYETIDKTFFMIQKALNNK